jgi:VWFA-related protein
VALFRPTARSLTLVAFSSLLPFNILASETPVVRVSLDLVQVDAIVTDKQGRYVDDLTCEDFEIYEDKQPQPVTNCSYVPVAGSVASTTPSRSRSTPLRREEVQRTMVLVVDDLSLDLPSAAEVRRALTHFVDEKVLPGDLVSIVRTGSGVGALQQFTTDKRVLRAAIERVRYNGAADAFGSVERITLSRLSSGPGERDFKRLQDNVFSGGTIGTLRYVLRGLRDLPGRKALVFFSMGYPIRDPDDHSVKTAFGLAVPSIVDLANRASTVLYSVYAPGVHSTWSTEDLGWLSRSNVIPYWDRLDGLEAVSGPTGGLLLKGNNDLGLQLGVVLADQQGYYVIGYAPTARSFARTKDGRLVRHRVRVKVRRKGLSVRSRDGFYGITDAEMVAPPARDAAALTSALLSPFGQEAVKVDLRSLFFHDPARGALLHSFLRLTMDGLSLAPTPDGGAAARLEILALTFDAEGQIVDQVSRSGELQLASAARERAAREGLTYTLDVPVQKPGGYQLRVAVRDSVSGRIGSASQFVEVPDLGRKALALSGLLITSAQSEGDSEAVEDVHRFAPGQPIAYGVAVYNARVAPETATARMQTQVRLVRDGRELLAGAVREVEAAPGGLVGGVLTLPQNLAAGEYELHVTVTDGAVPEKPRAAAQVATFEVAALPPPPGVSE